MNMGHGLSSNDPTVTAAFRNALDHQLLVVLLLGLALVLVWNTVRTLRLRRAAQAAPSGLVEVPMADARPLPYPEPAGRRLLRVSFGVLWILDGLLQTQASMPLGLPSQVVTPSADSSPSWVQHVVASGVSIWNDHPVSAAAATVWIQVGIGLFLLVAPRGRWSRTAGLISAGWGIVVWVFGEAFGGVFGHGASWLFGTPGAAVFYVVAGVLIALADQRWETARLGRLIVRCTGVFFVAMAVLEAWPGRGFWSGTTGGAGSRGVLSSMALQMSQLSQPSVTAAWARWFGSVAAAHGAAVNTVVVVLLAGIGGCFLSARPRVVRIGVVTGAALCLATWVLVQDFGFFGGVGTDPNSMIPMILVFTGGYVALVRLPVRAPAEDAAPARGALADAVGEDPDRPEGHDGIPGGSVPSEPVPVGGGRLMRLQPSYLLRSLAAIGAIGVVLVGAAPMALASTNPSADPIVNDAVNGTPNRMDTPAPPFNLTDQNGATVSLATLAGRPAVVTFLDPTCTSDCPLIAQELRIVDRMLGAEASRVAMVAVVDNPLYTSSAATLAFDRQEGMDTVPNWHFVTGPLPSLRAVWNAYGVETVVSPAGAMVAHGDLVYLIDGRGHLRVVLSADPGSQGDTALRSSFTAVLTAEIQALANP